MEKEKYKKLIMINSSHRYPLHDNPFYKVCYFNAMGDYIAKCISVRSPLDEPPMDFFIFRYLNYVK